MNRGMLTLVLVLVVGLMGAKAAFPGRSSCVSGPYVAPSKAHGYLSAGWRRDLVGNGVGSSAVSRASPVLVASLRDVARDYGFELVRVAKYGPATLLVVQTDRKATLRDKHGSTTATQAILALINPDSGYAATGGYFFEARDARGLPFFISESIRSERAAASGHWGTYPSYSSWGCVMPRGDDLPLCKQGETPAKNRCAAS
jgi:hypothetical protein